MQPRDFLTYYSTKFDTVEVEAAFYRAPTVQGWGRKTPKGFVFAAKVPQVIVYEKLLVDRDADFKQFIEVMDNLGDKSDQSFSSLASSKVRSFAARMIFCRGSGHS
jgi:uncharacterized protein YecE (DUF72 family)